MFVFVWNILKSMMSLWGVFLILCFSVLEPRRKAKYVEGTKRIVNLRHKAKVEKLQEKIRDLYERKKTLGKESNLYYSRTKSTTPHSPPTRKKYNRNLKDEKIFLNFDEILEINREELYCVAEASCTFEDIARECMKYELIPLVVPELKTITVGGAIAGGSLESMSFRFGGFHQNCMGIEFVDGKGERRYVENDPEGDTFPAFQMLHGTFGTLGVITSVKFRLIPTGSRYVRVDYLHFETMSDALKEIIKVYERSKENEENYELLDGIVHSEKDIVLCLGSFPTRSIDSPIIPESKFFEEPFYKRSKYRKFDYFRIEDYFFRYDSDCHWSVKNLPLFENKIFRKVFKNWVLGSSNILRLGQRFPFFIPDPPDVIVDVFIPIDKAEEFYEWMVKTFDYFPIWVVPYTATRTYTAFLADESFEGMDDDEDLVFIDFAIYGFSQVGKKANYYRLMEKKVEEMKGYKTLISYNYYTEEEFWKIFNKPYLDEMKSIHDPMNLFKDLFTKTKSIK